MGIPLPREDLRAAVRARAHHGGLLITPYYRKQRERENAQRGLKAATQTRYLPLLTPSPIHLWERVSGSECPHVRGASEPFGTQNLYAAQLNPQAGSLCQWGVSGPWPGGCPSRL